MNPSQLLYVRPLLILGLEDLNSGYRLAFQAVEQSLASLNRNVIRK